MKSKNLNIYYDNLVNNIKNIDINQVLKAIKTLEKAIKRNAFVYSCGNGGSAAIANHFHVDYLKGINQFKKKKSRFLSLCSNIETITAIANDFGYEYIFSRQLNIYLKRNDVVFCISSSGNSKNIINALKLAKEKKIKSILLSGFDGGKASKIADININIKSNNYGIIEDCHQSIMHLISQKIAKII